MALWGLFTDTTTATSRRRPSRWSPAHACLPAQGAISLSRTPCVSAFEAYFPRNAGSCLRLAPLPALPPHKPRGMPAHALVAWVLFPSSHACCVRNVFMGAPGLPALLLGRNQRADREGACARAAAPSGLLLLVPVPFGREIAALAPWASPTLILSLRAVCVATCQKKASLLKQTRPEQSCACLVPNVHAASGGYYSCMPLRASAGPGWPCSLKMKHVLCACGCSAGCAAFSWSPEPVHFVLGKERVRPCRSRTTKSLFQLSCPPLSRQFQWCSSAALRGLSIR